MSLVGGQALPVDTVAQVPDVRPSVGDPDRAVRTVMALLHAADRAALLHEQYPALWYRLRKYINSLNKQGTKKYLPYKRTRVSRF